MLLCIVSTKPRTAPSIAHPEFQRQVHPPRLLPIRRNDGRHVHLQAAAALVRKVAFRGLQLRQPIRLRGNRPLAQRDRSFATTNVNL
jgi:hypothetical protein